MTKRIFRILSAALLTSALLACGQKGPLYVPPEPETTEGPQQTAEQPVADSKPENENKLEPASSSERL